MSRHSRTPSKPINPTNPPSTRGARPKRSLGQRFLVNLGTFLALSGAFAAAAAAVFSIIPATSIKVDPALRGPAGPMKPARLVGLDHSGGDLRRAPRLTRRARRLGVGMPWMDGTAALPRKAAYSVMIAST